MICFFFFFFKRLTSAFCYYGLVLMTTELFQGSQNSAKKSESCAADCKELTTTDYIDLLWTTLAEFPGILVTIFIIERFGRRKTMTVQHLVFSFCVFFILFATSELVSFFLMRLLTVKFF
mgnify:CR=1 FL=1